MSVNGGDYQQEDGDDDGSLWTRGGIEGIIATWVVGLIYGFRDRVLDGLIAAREAAVGGLEDSGGAVMDAVVYVAEVPLSLYGVLETTLADLAASAGPLAPIVVIVSWAIAGLLVAALVRFLVWLLPLVIPWL